MNKFILIVAFTLMFKLLWSQSEKLSWKEKSEIFEYVSGMNDYEHEFTHNLLDSLHSVIIDFVDRDAYFDNEIIRLMNNDEYSEFSINTFAIHYLELKFQRGGTFCVQRGAIFPEKKYKNENRTFYHMMELNKALNERKEIPVELIQKYSVDFNLCFLDYKFYFAYDLKIKGINQVEIIKKSFVRIR